MASLPGGLDFLKGAGLALSLFPSLAKARGGGAPGGAGAERRTPWPALRSGRSPVRRRSPANDAGRHASRRSTAAFSFRRRAALSTGGGWALGSSPPAVSQLLAGDRSAPGRSPDAARVRALRGTPAGAAPAEARDFPRRRPPKKKSLFSGLSFGSSRLHDASRSAPQWTRLRRE